MPDPSVTRDHFVKELDLAHDIMFSSWLSRGDAKAKQSVLEALGQMAGLLSAERVSKVPFTYNIRKICGTPAP